MSKMDDLDLFSKLSKFKGDSKFKFKIRLFLLNPKLYYKMWKNLKILSDYYEGFCSDSKL